MRGLYGFVIVLLLSAGAYSSSLTLWKAPLDRAEIPEILNATVINAKSDNILDFLTAVNDSAKAIQASVDLEALNVMDLLTYGTNVEASRFGFLFGVSIIKESTAKVLSLVNNIKEKLELIQTEKKLRDFVAKLLPGERWASADVWLKNKANEITEDVAILKMHYTELYNSYQNYLKTVNALVRNSATAAPMSFFKPIILLPSKLQPKVFVTTTPEPQFDYEEEEI